MGRRIFLIIVITLSGWMIGPFSRAQDPKEEGPPIEPAPPNWSGIPLSLPNDLVPGEDEEGRGKAAAKARQAGEGKDKTKRAQGARQLKASSRPAAPKKPENAPALDLEFRPAQLPADGQGQRRPGGVPAAPPGRKGGAAATGAVEPATPPPSPEPSGEPEPSRPDFDRLPLGKQSLAVTVDVQAPPSMNLNQEGNLKLIVRNTGSTDVFNVIVSDVLPEGLEYVSSQPEARVVRDSLLTWRISNLPAGSDRPITIRVKPTKPGPFEHGATVTLLTGSKARSRVLEPKLKVDVTSNPTAGKVLKGQSVEFKVSVQNTGDGVARNVSIQAKLSPGLRHESGERGEEQMMYELTLPELAAGQTEKLDPLVADAILGGPQKCTVVARSPDVVFNPDEAENVRTVSVVEPKLALALKGPDTRYTDTVADYEITLENPGTAPARKVRVLTTLPINGRLVKATPEPSRYDSTTRRVQWLVDQLESQAKPRTFRFQVRMGGIGDYEVLAEAIGEGALAAKDRLHTDVQGMPDVDLVVSESKRVVDVGGKTTFRIRLTNYGTKEATNLNVIARLSKNLKVEEAGTEPKSEVKQLVSPDKDSVAFYIEKLGAHAEMLLGVLARVESDEPRQATCRVSVTHQDLPEPFDDMATLKVASSSRRAAPHGP